MKSVSTKCIILGHKNIGESDKLIFFYSEDFGKIKVIAKGARKITSKFTGHLETINTCIASIYFGPKNIILTEITTEKSNKEIRNNLERLQTTLKIAELTNRILFENQKLNELIPLIEKSAKGLCTTKKHFLILSAFIIKLFTEAGLIPDFKEIDSKIEKKYLKFFHFIKEQELEEINKINLTKEEELIIQKILNKVTEYHLPTPLLSN
jgi:DNA repair protein RecO (recombination protein O)